MSELAERLAEEFGDKEYAHAYMEEHGNMAIAAQIRTLREQRGLTQKQLASLAGMKQERISALESVDYDAWTVSTLRKLADAFDTHLSVAFVPFSQGILDIVNLRRETLQVNSREADLAEFRNRRIVHTGGAWKAVCSDHLATVTSLRQPTPGPLEPRSQWQEMQRVVTGR